LLVTNINFSSAINPPLPDHQPFDEFLRDNMKKTESTMIHKHSILGSQGIKTLYQKQE